MIQKITKRVVITLKSSMLIYDHLNYRQSYLCVLQRSFVMSHIRVMPKIMANFFLRVPSNNIRLLQLLIYTLHRHLIETL